MDGLVLVGSHFVESEEAGNAYIRRAAQEVPVMLLGGALAGQNLYAVRCDERAAMRGAVRRLLASGRQNVLYLYNSMSFSGRNKLAGYREGYADAGRSAPEGLALMLDAYRFDVAQVRGLLARKWDAGARFDAVLAADDRLAVGAAKFAKLRGLRIPQDLSIIGCNNSPIARYCDPELTSIDNRLGDLCAACVDGLMAVLEGKPCPADGGAARRARGAGIDCTEGERHLRRHNLLKTRHPHHHYAGHAHPGHHRRPKPHHQPSSHRNVGWVVIRSGWRRAGQRRHGTPHRRSSSVSVLVPPPSWATQLQLGV